MKIDTMLNEFVETYPRDAIQAIDNMKNDFGRTYRGHTIPLTNIAESCDSLSDWIKGYAAYCVEQTTNGENPTPAIMMEAFDRLLGKPDILSKKDFTYPEIPSFVQGYINGINHIKESVTEAKTVMLENDVNHTLIGNIDEFADRFAESLEKSVNEGMDKLLWASGYNSAKILFGKSNNTEKAPIIV